MAEFDTFFWQDNFAWIVCGVAALISVFAGYADIRRQKRKNIEDVGFMPWTNITVIAGIIAFSFLIFALSAG